MRMWFFLAVLATGAAAHAGPPENVCTNLSTTVEGQQCTAAAGADAHARMQQYLEAARKRLAGGEAKVDLDKEQAAWTAYRDAHCGNIYDYWSGGSIRHEKYNRCARRLHISRTHDIWRAYLTYTDSTPPILPEPE